MWYPASSPAVSQGSRARTAAEIHAGPHTGYTYVCMYPSPRAATTGRDAEQRETSKFRCAHGRDKFLHILVLDPFIYIYTY